MGSLPFHCYLVSCNRCGSISISHKGSSSRTQVQTAQRLHYRFDQLSLDGKSPKYIQAPKNRAIGRTMTPEKVVGVPSTSAPSCPPLYDSQPRNPKTKSKSKSAIAVGQRKFLELGIRTNSVMIKHSRIMITNNPSPSTSSW